MAYLLSGERSSATAVIRSPLVGLVRWFEKSRKARAQKLALASLLELEDFRLDDLGISRQDILDAVENPDRNVGAHLAARRSHRARSWFRY